jgi:hypothetical protein
MQLFESELLEEAEGYGWNYVDTDYHLTSGSFMTFKRGGDYLEVYLTSGGYRLYRNDKIKPAIFGKAEGYAFLRDPRNMVIDAA